MTFFRSIFGYTKLINMGLRLIDYYKKLNLKGRIKLSKLTGMSSVRASEEPDSDENIEMFEKTMEQIKADEYETDKK